MTKLRVDNVTQAKIAEQIVVEDQSKRIHLFTHSTLEAQRKTFAGIGRPDLSAISSSAQGDDHKRGAKADEEETISIKSRDGTVIEMPRLSSEQLAEIDSILSGATPEQAEHLVRSGRLFAAETYNEIEEGRAEGPYSLASTSSAQQTYEAYVATTGQRVQEDQVTGAVLMGMYGVETNLKTYFERVKQEQQLANELRADVAEIEDALADWPDDGSTETFDYREVTFNEDGSVNVVEHTNVTMTKAEAEALSMRLKGGIEGLGQFENREMYALQMMVNKYQQAMNTLSNIMKSKDDTHKAIISNAKA